MIPESRVLVVLERRIVGLAGALAVVVDVVLVVVTVVTEVEVVAVEVVTGVVEVVEVPEQPTSRLTLTASAVIKDRMGKSFRLNILIPFIYSVYLFSSFSRGRVDSTHFPSNSTPGKNDQ